MSCSALPQTYRADSRERSLRLEAKAHITDQRWIDEDGLASRAVPSDGIVETHLQFGQQSPRTCSQARTPASGFGRYQIPYDRMMCGWATMSL